MTAPTNGSSTERLAKIVEKIEQDLYSVQTERPGVFMRLDRIESKMRTAIWLMSGGLASILGTIILLWQILAALSETKL